VSGEQRLSKVQFAGQFWLAHYLLLILFVSFGL